MQAGDRTLLAELFHIVSERADTKFKFLTLSPKIYLSGADVTAKIQAGSEKVLDLGSYSGAGRPKGTQFIHAQVMLLVLVCPASSLLSRHSFCIALSRYSSLNAYLA
jgi:hypothetical protein